MSLRTILCVCVKSKQEMGLPPLEYIDCILDSPKFREIISLYEKELEDNAQSVISLVKECEHMIQATKGRSLGCNFRLAM